MNNMKWLVRREIWEHKGMFIWAPLVTALLILLAVVGGSYAAASNGKVNGVKLTVNGQVMETRVNNLPPELADIGGILSTAYLGTAVPLLALMTFAVFFYCLGSMYDERRDRSILFWKSLPLSDRETVLSKYAMAAILVPLFYLVVGIVLSVLVLVLTGLVISLSLGVNILPAVLSQGATYTAPLFLLSLLPVYAVWALPTIGWLMLVSSWARSKVFIWAIGGPLVALILLNYIEFLTGSPALVWLAQDAVPRLLAGIIPGSWIGFADLDVNAMMNPDIHMIDMGRVAVASWGSLLSSAAIAGAAAGVAMIAAAIRMRRWRDEG